ncbi:hypothetical protein GCM10011395_23330 [Sphingomonas psychrolutea]|uniref:Uncharacterized protein n=1 Tax=Sphingomonas psychrolutea TaxID=1259676 RepID=A0ABQ1GYD0_9SPHN|nr:hypothetical protein GCM10011395_23330 [Sphingomonas psychrolutea]
MSAIGRNLPSVLRGQPYGIVSHQSFAEPDHTRRRPTRNNRKSPNLCDFTRITNITRLSHTPALHSAARSPK